MTHDDVLTTLATIPDPEMPISITDLGLVEDVRVENNGVVEIDLLPTFVGCPALPMIEQEVREKVRSIGADTVRVNFINDPPWSVDRISDAGRASLAEHGVTVPSPGSCAGGETTQTVAVGLSAIACPFCGSSDTRLDSPFGPTRCRMIMYCEGCRNSFEHMKRI